MVDPKPSEAFRKNVRALLRRQGVTMQQLAKTVGTSQPAISRVLSGDESVTIERADRIAKAVGFSLAALISEDFAILEKTS